MGSLFKSEFMDMIQIIVQNDAAHQVVRELGKLGLVEFRDMNKDTFSFQRSFVDEVKACEELERKLRALAKDVLDADLPIHPLPAQIDNPPLSIPELENKLSELEKEVRQMKSAQLQLLRNDNALQEQKYVLLEGAKIGPSMTNQQIEANGRPQVRQELLSAQESGAGDHMLSCVAGVVPRNLAPAFERVIFRSTRGNSLVKMQQLEHKLMDSDPKKSEKIEKNFFMIFFSGQQLNSKVSKICSYFGASLYNFPDTEAERSSLLAEMERKLEDSTKVVRNSASLRNNVLEEVSLKWFVWSNYVRQEKMIYNTLNLFDFDIRRSLFVAEGWIPRNRIDDVHRALGRATAGVETKPIVKVIETRDSPPTYFVVNRVFKGFQNLVDTYGIPRYREVNPGIFTIIMFPFLFGIMFGDFGHGLLLFLFGVFLINREKHWEGKKLNDMVSMCYKGRYIILFNGAFAVYTGLLYSEVFAVPMDLFGTKYDEHEKHLTGTYPFGIDPMWHHSDNSITFFNSYKMKLSIIVGVIQMTFGIILSSINHLEYKSMKNIFCEFIPQMIFMSCTFGYLVLMIFLKWSMDWSERTPPSLMTTLILMFMSPGYLPEEDRLYPAQPTVQFWLVVAAGLSVPWMLFVKPYLINREHKKDPEKYMLMHSHGDEEFNFQDIAVHQMIHTIEFVLGCVSNTASYLRLWALSLAHQQLSELFWVKLLVGIGLSSGSWIYTFILFCIWASISLVVLMVMENLSSFLHALRLQWVEFQSKFYMGDGRKFQPFSFTTAQIRPM